MLNRTNRTLSAKRNRLNLGTRSLAVQGEVNGKNTLRVRHAHGFAMRDGMFAIPDPSIQQSRIGSAGIPCSSPVEPWPVVGPDVRTVVGLAVTPAVRTARTASVACAVRTAQGRSHARPSRRAASVHRAWSAAGYARGAYAAVSAAAATVAAAGG